MLLQPPLPLLIEGRPTNPQSQIVQVLRPYAQNVLKAMSQLLRQQTVEEAETQR